MLKTEYIGTSKLDKENWNYKEEWRAARLAKFTSSMIYTLMGESTFTQGAMTYIYERVGESLTGIPAKQEIDTNATRWGLLHESAAIKRFGAHSGVPFVITQCLVTQNGSMFGSTPDCLLIKKSFDDCYEVETGEVKCYPSYSHYISCALCNTPEEIKKVDPKLFWQVIDQMDNCDCLVGYAILYHPDFKFGGFKIIQFKKIELVKYFKLLRERKSLAVEKFNEIRDRLINMKN